MIRTTILLLSLLLIGAAKPTYPNQRLADGTFDLLDNNNKENGDHASFHAAVVAAAAAATDYDYVDKLSKEEKEEAERILSQRGDSCQNYNTCIECDATYTCHWCAHDESCHIMGSIYGCSVGVQCFDEDRCKRKEPEPLPLTRNHFTNLNLFPLILVGIITCLAFCCVSLCLCFACGMKGVYDDLCGRIMSSSTSHHHYRSVRLEDSTGNDHGNLELSNNERDSGIPIEETHNGGESAAAACTDEETAPVPRTKNQEEGKQSTTALVDGARPTGDCSQEEQQQQQQQDEEEEEEEEGTPLLVHTGANNNFPDEQDQHTPVVQESSSKKARKMISICTCLYFFVVLAIGSLSFVVVRFFPMIPAYSVCNDGVQWGSLFKRLATLNVQVDFEILMSIENANHLGVIVERGNGTFYHGGHLIGNYSIPHPVRAPAMAISDVIILATLQPKGKTEVMSLLEEYVEDSLVLHIDADLRVRVPSLFNFATNVSIADHPIEINRDEDRHLCACKKWDNSSTILQLGMDLLHSLFDSGVP